MWKDAHQTMDGDLWRGKLEWRAVLVLAFSIFVLLEFFFMENMFNKTLIKSRYKVLLSVRYILNDSPVKKYKVLHKYNFIIIEVPIVNLHLN